MDLFGKLSSWNSQDFPYRMCCCLWSDIFYQLAYWLLNWGSNPTGYGTLLFRYCAQNKAEISLEIKWPQHATDHLPSSSSKVENVCSFASTASSCLHSVVFRPVATSSSLYFSNLLIKLLVCSTEQHDTTMYVVVEAEHHLFLTMGTKWKWLVSLCSIHFGERALEPAGN